MRKPLFPITYIILIIGKRGRSVRGRLKGLNSVAIKFIKIPIKIFIKR